MAHCGAPWIEEKDGCILSAQTYRLVQLLAISYSLGCGPKEPLSHNNMNGSSYNYRYGLLELNLPH